MPSPSHLVSLSATELKAVMEKDEVKEAVAMADELRRLLYTSEHVTSSRQLSEESLRKLQQS